jgi:hypothetical protein
MTARTGQVRQDNRDGTTMLVERGHLGHDIWDRNTQTRHLGRTVVTGQSQQVGLTGSLDAVSLERTEMTGLPGHDSGVGG